MMEPETGSLGNLADALRITPGVIVQEGMGAVDPPRISVRGSGIQSAPLSRGLSLWLDGAPLNYADGSFNLAVVESNWLRGVNVSSATMGGSVALGGVIGLWTDSQFESNGVSLDFGYSTHATRYGSMRFRRRIDHAYLTGALAASYDGGWRSHADQSRETVIAALRVPVGEANASDETAVSMHFLAANPRFNVPGPLVLHAALHDPESVSMAVARDRPSRKTDYARLVTSVFRRTEFARVSIGSAVVMYDDQFQQLLPNGISVQSGEDFALFGDAVRYWDRNGVDKTRLQVLVQTGSRDAFRFRNHHGTRGEQVGDNRFAPVTALASASHQHAILDKFRVEVGAAILYARRSVAERFEISANRAATDLRLSDFRLAPSVTGTWSLHGLELKLSWQRAFEPPTFDDLIVMDGPLSARVLRANPLDWQEADSWELAAHGGSENIQWSIATYHSRRGGELLRMVDASGVSRGTVNADRTIHNGFDGAFDWTLLRTEEGSIIRLRGLYHLIIARFDDDHIYDDRRLAGVPRHSGTVEAHASLPGGWHIVPSLQWRASGTFADHWNTLQFPALVTVGLEISLTRGRWTFWTRMSNLFDRQYIAGVAGVLDRATDHATAAVFLPGAPRSIAIGTRVEW